MMGGPLFGDQHINFTYEIVGIGPPKENLHQIMPFYIVFGGSITRPDGSDEVSFLLLWIFVDVVDLTSEMQNAILFHGENKFYV